MRTSKLIGLAVLSMLGSAPTIAKAESPFYGTIVVSDDYYPFGPACDGNREVYAAFCADSYCDNLTFSCKSSNRTLWVNNTAYQLSTSGGAVTNTLWFSSANGIDSGRGECPGGYAMVGAYSYGAYSANLKVICAQMMGFPSGHGLYKMTDARRGPISEESPGNPQFKTTQTWEVITGMSCSGTNCDNNYFWVSEIW